MKIDKIILYDNGVKDKTQFMDLIYFEKEIEEYKIQEIINNVIENNPCYTNEDIYNGLDKEIGIKDLIYIGNMTQFSY